MKAAAADRNTQSKAFYTPPAHTLSPPCALYSLPPKLKLCKINEQRKFSFCFEEKGRKTKTRTKINSRGGLGSKSAAKRKAEAFFFLGRDGG